MKSAQKTVGAICYGLLGLGLAATFGGALMMASAELIPAQVYPAKRESGESCFRNQELMDTFAGLGKSLLSTTEGIRKPDNIDVEAINPNPPAENLPKDFGAWQKDIEARSLGHDYVEKLKTTLGGQDDLKKMVELVIQDRNYVYYAYSLFLGLAMFASALAIQAVGRQDSEEITVLPVKK